MIGVTLGAKAKNYDFDVANVDMTTLQGTDPSYTISSKGLTIAESKSDYVVLEGKFDFMPLSNGNYKKGIEQLDAITVVENGKVSYRATNLGMTGSDAANASMFKDFLAGESYSIKGNAYANDITGAGMKDVIRGLDGNDKIHGLGGNDRLSGDVGNDRIFGGLGNDLLSGGSGSDRFVFASGDGTDVISDFAASGKGRDLIDLSGHFDVASFDDLVIGKAGRSVVIEAGDDAIELRNIKLSAIDESDFLF
jgi:Ca2+-binding RTX toxin-like protein